MKRPSFRPGRNIAVKVPTPQFQATVAFYRDVLGFEQVRDEPASAAFAFGDKVLWVDRVGALSHAEVWLEVEAADTEAAARYLEERGVVRRDEVEQLPEGFRGFWVASPAGTIHLVSGE